ncbi:MAG: hypothetical protein LBE13_20105 [Bacteroidales bacterium]|jgi:hypothetical protein|nr:hypothetical protein [Bacteroidales bacterium]
MDVVLELNIEDWLMYCNTIERFINTYTDKASYYYLRDIYLHQEISPHSVMYKVLENANVLENLAYRKIGSNTNPDLFSALWGFSCLCKEYCTTKEKSKEFRDMLNRKLFKFDKKTENRKKIHLANPWGHRYHNEQPNENIRIKTGLPFTMSVEWGEGDWETSFIGYGVSTDGSYWTWQEINYFKDGIGYNKCCKTTLRIYNQGKYYYAYKIDKNGKISYCLGDSAWKENTSLLAATRYIEIIER